MTEEYCNHNLKDINHMLRAAHTFLSFMDGLCSWLDSSGSHFRIDSFDGTDTYVIQFDLVRKFSLYFKKQIKLVFKHIDVQNAEAEMTDNTAMPKINE